MSSSLNSPSPNKRPPGWARDLFEQSEDAAPPQMRPAAAVWEILRTEVGPVRNPHFVLSVRRKNGNTGGRVLVESADVERVAQIERAARRALESLNSVDFASLLKLTLPEADAEKKETEPGTNRSV